MPFALLPPFYENEERLLKRTMPHNPDELRNSLLCALQGEDLADLKTVCVYFHSDGFNDISERSDVASSGVYINSPYHNGKPLNSDNIFIDKLIHLCIENKSFHSLKCISRCLSDKGWPFPVYLRESPPALILNLRFTDIPNMLVISKDPRNGRLQCIMFDYNLSPNNLLRKKFICKSLPSIVQKHLDELGKCIFDHVNYATEYLTQFRAQFRLWHFEQQILDMNLCVSSRLPLLNEEALPNISNFREKDSKISSFYFRIFIKLQTSFYYLILSMCPDISSQNPGHVKENLYLLHTQEAPFTFHDISNSRNHKSKLDNINTSIYRELSNNVDFQEKCVTNLPTSFLTVCKIFRLGSDVTVRDGFDCFSMAPLQRRRMRSYGSQFILRDENIRWLSLYELSDHIFTLDILISIFHLQHALKQVNNLEHFLVSSQALQHSSRTLVLVMPPCPSNVCKPVYSNFCNCLYYCRFSLMPNKHWLVQLVFSTPIIFSNNTQYNLSYNVCEGATLFEQFYSDFESILMLYGSIVEFSLYLQSSTLLRKKFKVKRYDYTHLSITFCGEEIEFSPGALISLYWNSNERKFHLEFTNMPQSFAQSSYEEAFNSNYSIPQLLFGLLKLFPFYRLIEQSIMNSRTRFQAGPFPGIIRLVFKLFIDFEIHNNNKIIIHPHRHESNERVFNLLEQFIESFKVGEINSRDNLDICSLQIPAIARSYSLSSGSPGFPLKPFSPASKLTSIAQTPFTASKASPFFPNYSAFSSKTHQQFFPTTNGLENLYNSRKYQSKSIPFSTFKVLLLPKKKFSNPPLANFLGNLFPKISIRLCAFRYYLYYRTDHCCSHIFKIKITMSWLIIT
ncbi:hypothetical protein LOD99_15178 [Oopsacas minuta]|uniref:Mediator of RNA polymerase II transcription subunit 14 n=1 Tax=Oopsacas minuta TaxID=111878 RepID=A0AAV7KDA3_9METZ|nr:hypothetical protein LOD99_15178 [Oopsacas minuta]